MHTYTCTAFLGDDDKDQTEMITFQITVNTVLTK